MKNILIDAQFSSTQVCIVEDGVLVEFWVERRDSAHLVGNIYKGKVKNVLPGMQASFVNIGLERNGFLYAGDIVVDGEAVSGAALNVKAGDKVLCQVIKDQFGGKGARLTMNVTLAGRVLVLMPQVDYIGVSRKIVDEERRAQLTDYLASILPDKCGCIMRTQSEHCTLDEIKSELDELYARWLKIKRDFLEKPAPSLLHKEESVAVRAVRDMLRDDVDKVIINDRSLYEEFKGAFHYILADRPELFELDESNRSLIRKFNLSEQVARLVKRKVPLPNGGNLVIDRTEALTVIDVNTGKYVGESNLEQTVFETNCIAAEEIARQVRLRNISGIIVIDFIDMNEPKHTDKVLEVLKSWLAKDRIKTSVLGVTSLGLVEMTRKKTRSMIESALLQECPYCGGEGHVFSDEYVIGFIRERLRDVIESGNEVKAVKVTVAPSVFTKLTAHRYLTRESATLWRDVTVYVIADPNKHVETFDITVDNSDILSLPDGARLLC